MIDTGAMQAFIKRLSAREKALFYAAAAAVFLSVLVGMVVLPSFNKIDSLQKEIDETMLTLQKDLRFLSYKPAIEELSAQYAPYLNEASSPEEEKNALIKVVENAATVSGVTLSSRTASFSSQQGQRIYTVNVNCKGTMPHLTQFLWRLEHAKKLLDVIRLTLSPEVPGSSTIQARLLIRRITISK